MLRSQLLASLVILGFSTHLARSRVLRNTDIVRGTGFAQPPSAILNKPRLSDNERTHLRDHYGQDGFYGGSNPYSGITFSPTEESVLEDGPPYGDLRGFVDAGTGTFSFENLISRPEHPSRANQKPDKAIYLKDWGSSKIKKKKHTKEEDLNLEFSPTKSWKGDKIAQLLESYPYSINQRDSEVQLEFVSPYLDQSSLVPRNTWTGEKATNLAQYQSPTGRRKTNVRLDHVSRPWDQVTPVSSSSVRFAENVSEQWVPSSYQPDPANRKRNVQSEPEVITWDNLHQYLPDRDTAGYDRGSNDFFTVNVQSSYTARGPALKQYQ